MARNTESMASFVTKTSANRQLIPALLAHRGQTMEQHGREPVVLESVGNHECDLSLRGVNQAVVAAYRNELVVLFHHQGHAVSAIHFGQMCDLGYLQDEVWVEVPGRDRHRERRA